MKFTICDDTLSDLNALESIIISYARTNNCSIEIEKFNNPEVLLKHVEFNKDDYHIFFLDVVMQKRKPQRCYSLRFYFCPHGHSLHLSAQE